MIYYIKLVIKTTDTAKLDYKHSIFTDHDALMHC